jgi:hypothetical protein
LCTSVTQERVRGTVQQARDDAKANSLHPFYNPLWDLPYGDSPAGIFGATPFELLHQYGLGIEKYAFNFTWETIACSTARRGLAAESMRQRLDARLAQFNTRHADSEMPRNRFSNGAYQLSFLTSSEYRALMYQV